MKTAEKNDISKKIYLSTDIDAEYFNLLNSIIQERQLGSRREGLAVIFEGYKRSLKTSTLAITDENSEQAICDFLSDDKTLCGKNKEKLKKTTASLCNACQKAQQTLKKQQQTEEIKMHGEILRHDLTERMWVLELGIPFEKTGYDTFSRLTVLKDKIDQKDREIAKFAPLENDNAFLKQQLTEKDQEIERLNAEIQQKDTAIKNYMYEKGKPNA